MDMTKEQLQERIRQLEEREARLVSAAKARDSQPLRWKVGDKGGVVLSGTGRYPVTQFYGQWMKIFSVLQVPKDNVFRVFVEEQKALGNLSLKEHEE